ncbi:hypothetical protein HP548_02705 [Paenibacillus taichungensis]|uniref:Lipoprotein n=1 Tax=Paenibacillus taichungensis TaxID=484184 RepID=A0ABX2MGH3_9BACL|nr:hypothetical protein [Paenibacillus taichungensis]NUU53006.1 hypothetical protein [Paenibacillus taichungensis]
MTMLTVLTTVLILGACGTNKDSGQTVEDSIYDNPRNHTAEDFMPLSEALEKYPVWFEAGVYPTRNTAVHDVYVFENGNATHYWNLKSLPIDEYDDLSDDEIIKYVKENSTAKATGKYILDITLDELGQSTQEIEVILENGKIEYYYPKGSNLDGEILTEEKTITMETDHLVTFEQGSNSQKIFNTTYSGLAYNKDFSLFTRVDDSFVGFKLDDPDTKNEKVTIEGK